MNQEMYEEAVRSNVLSRQLIEELLNSLDYTGISFINSTIEVLKVLRTRLERGDRITDEVSGITYTMDSVYKFVKDHFSSYILSQVFDDPAHAEKVYFSLEACDGGYNLVMADSSHNKTYEWISSLSERFSLVHMISTGIVYLKDVKTNTYQPFISGNGKYCRYDKKSGHLVEL